MYTCTLPAHVSMCVFSLTVCVDHLTKDFSLKRMRIGMVYYFPQFIGIHAFQ